MSDNPRTVWKDFQARHPLLADGTPERRYGDYVYCRDHMEAVRTGKRSYAAALTATAQTVYRDIDRPDADPDRVGRLVQEMRAKRGLTRQ